MWHHKTKRTVAPGLDKSGYRAQGIHQVQQVKSTDIGRGVPSSRYKRRSRTIQAETYGAETLLEVLHPPSFILK